MALKMRAVRLDPDTLERVDALIPLLAGRLPGATVTEADALRAAVQRGLEALESELGAKPKRKGGRARKTK